MTYESLLTNPAIEVLGRSLLHFLWQGTLLAAALWVVNVWTEKSMARQSAARIRYAAAGIVMLLMLGVLVGTIAYNSPSPAQALAPGRPAPLSSLPAAGLSQPAVEATPNGIALAGWAVCFWFAGVLLLSGRAAGGWIRAQMIKRRGCQPVSPELSAAFERLKQHLQVVRPARLYASALAKAPIVIGWIRPYILLPVTAITGLTEAQLQSVLAHELAHIRRHDYLVNLLQAAVETLLFYHPAVWWVSRQMRIERENCCDDLAIEICGDAPAYARTLAQLEELRIGAPELAVAADGGDLLGRVRRLLEPAPSKHGLSKSMAALVVALFVIGLILTPVIRTLNAAPEQATPAPTLPSKRASTSAAGQAPQSRPVDPQTAPTANGAGNNRGNEAGNGIGNGVGNGFGDGLGEIGAQYQREIDRYARAIEETQSSLFANGLIRFNQVAAYAAGGGPSAQSTELLIKLYDGSKDVEVKRQILDYLAGSSTQQASEKLASIARSDSEPELRRYAIDYLAEKADSAPALIRMYDESRDPEIKRHILDYLAGSNSPQASEKLLTVARSDAEPELRLHAIDYIAGRTNAFDALVSLYDDSREPEIKQHLLDYIGSSRDPRALDKLFSIAQSDPDRELRRHAVDYIAGR